MRRDSPGGGVGSLYRRVRDKPPRELVAQVARRFAAWSDLPSLEFPLFPEDIADSETAPRSRPRPPASTPRVGWLVVPPGRGSGGHTTLFRIIRAVADAGMHCTLLFYDRYRGDFERNAARVREWWPWLDVDIRPVDDRIEGYDAVVASSWPTAHVLASRGDAPMARLYFIQDYEPYFHPRGGIYALAEDSYRFGFRNMALGGMVAKCLAEELDVPSDIVTYGLDTDVYRLLESGSARRGVVLYSRVHNDRRGQQLALRALELFHREHPDQPIHTYGDREPALAFPAQQHGILPTTQLNELYNHVLGGIALSFTNVSLVPEEMLTAGAIPVVNDGWMPRAALSHPNVAWALPTPRAIARALGEVVDRPDADAYARAAAAAGSPRPWATTGGEVVRMIEEELGVGRSSATN